MEDSHGKRELDPAEAHGLEQGEVDRSEAATLGKARLVDTDQALTRCSPRKKLWIRPDFP
jgi:hypothetical protein